jgi:hypothetical protein
MDTGKGSSLHGSPNAREFYAVALLAHLTSMINEAEDELVLFSGLGNGGPFPPTPMNHKVYTLDLEKAPSEQEGEERSADDVIPEPK